MALTRLNFIARPTLWPKKGLLWLLPAGALLIVAAQGWQQQQGQLQQVQNKWQTFQAQQMPPPRVQRSQEEQRQLEAQALQIAQAVRQLNLPIPTLLQALQPPADIHVALVSIEFGGKAAGSGGNANAVSLKLLAEAKSGADMVNYLAFLDDQALFASVYLQKHEIPPDSKEGHYRFQLEVQWQP